MLWSLNRLLPSFLSFAILHRATFLQILSIVGRIKTSRNGELNKRPETWPRLPFPIVYISSLLFTLVPLSGPCCGDNETFFVPRLCTITHYHGNCPVPQSMRLANLL